MEKIADRRILCLAGEMEEDSLCRKVDPQKIDVKILSGGPHFAGDYERISQVIGSWMEIE
jgi:type IV secretory pathway VirJ component